MNSLLFRNARIVDPSQDIDEMGYVLVTDGKIAELNGVCTRADVERVVDCGGAVLCPGLVDAHVHFRDPGQTAKEDLKSGCRAAAAGGFTSVITMANTSPAIDTPEAVADIIRRASSLDCRVYPAAGVTVGLKGNELTDFAALKAAGAVLLTDDGYTISDVSVMMAAFEAAHAVGLPVSVHCETKGLEGDRSMNRGDISKELGLEGVLPLAEELMIQRDLLLAGRTGARLHVQHVSTALGVEMIQHAKNRGVHVTAEATPHHMTLDESAVLTFGSDAKMSPPLRTKADAKQVRGALVDGVLDIIATDHAPHTPEEKALGMLKAPNGIIGLETSLPVCLTALCVNGDLPLIKLIDKMSTTPCRLFDLPGGTLKVGAPADITVFDPDSTFKVDANNFKSKARNCPFVGQTLNGVVKMTFVGGRLTYKK